MRYSKRPKKTGKPGQIKGTRLKRNLKFGPVIPASSGIKVRSQYEKICADWLNRNDIEFQYEPLMLIKGRQFRPDFYLPQHNLFLEICGYNHMPFYRDSIARKKALYDKYGLKSVFVNCGNLKSLPARLAEELSIYGLIISENK